jgi:integrase
MAIIPLHAKGLATLTCPPGSRKTDYRDALCKGLALEVRASGGRTWYLTYTNKRGKRHQHRLGDLRDLSLGQARALADRYRSQVAMGEDPAEQAALLRQVPTFSAFVDEQLLPHLKLTKRSWPCDWSVLKCHILPVFGIKPIDAITRTEILAFQVGKLEAGLAAGTVYKVMVLLRYALKLAIEWDVPGIKANPCTKVPLPKVNDERQRFLSQEEAQRLLSAVRGSSNANLEAIVTFLLLTGARKRECLDAKWEHIHWQQRRWFIPVTKTGHPRYVPLSDGALVMLRRLQLTTGSSPWMFPNPATGKPYQSIFHSWNTARRQASLADVRIHDLRHSFASFLINDGRSLYEVQQLLGHRNSSMTQRYAHLADERLLEASNSASEALGAVWE